MALVELLFGHCEDVNAETEVSKALNRVTGRLGWRDAEKGPFGGNIPDGAKVLIKPNCVLHATDRGPRGTEPLVNYSAQGFRQFQ